jgi:hypothetical protein
VSFSLSFVRRALVVGALSGAALLSVLALRSGPVRADDAKKGVTVEEIEYKGWKHNLKISNGDAELIVTLDVGPRIISYKLKDGKNVFKEFEDQIGKSGEPTWQIRGGTRLWVGPEDVTRTYYPDNGPVKYEKVSMKDAEGDFVIRFFPAPEKEYGIQKVLDVHLAPSGSAVRLHYEIVNIADKLTELAAWLPSVMAPGGVEVIPLPPHHPHPGPVKPETKPADYGPSYNMVVWPYFDFTDKRWSLGSKYITLRQDANKGPTKLGFSHRLGWTGYLNDGTLFVKRFGYQEGANYPDGGCNYETFTKEEFLEMESLGPVTTLKPNGTAALSESWELVKDVEDFTDEAGIDKNILPKVGGK